jgi:murein L,D-transpeptidase YcbB/YkuD
VLDKALSAALEAFQRRHGLSPTGWLDSETRRALNVTAGDRLRQIDVNLDRWRFAPRDLGDRHIRVNIPDFHLGVIERGRTVLGMRVIVGERDRQTPIFSDRITHIVFNPYWNIPDSIANDETLPAMMSDPEYLLRNNIEVVRVADGRVEPVDPAELDWTMPLDGSLRLRQRPGADNALGLVKFMFPNRSSVYLHDTPADRLFSRVARTLSHGCVRVERPVDLAHALLERYGWDEERIAEAMQGKTEQWIRVKEPVPVHLVYFTAWADSGRAQFRNDVYGHDRDQAAALDRRARHRRQGAGA